MTLPVLVTGATGQVGLHAVARLLKAGCEVIAWVRDMAHCGATDVTGLSRCGSISALSTMRAVEDGYSLLSCGPMTLALDFLQPPGADRLPTARRAVITGTTSLAVKQDSSDSSERQEIARIRSAHVTIAGICRQEHVPLAVIHPTLIYGCGMDQNLSRVYRWITRFGFAPVASRADGLRQPVHVADVAAGLVAAVTSRDALTLETPLCGGEKLAYSEMIGRLFDAAGKKRRLLSIPTGLAGPAASIGNCMSGRQRISAEMFHRQSRDLVFDDSVACRALGHRPRGFRPTAEDFRLSAEIEGIRNALQC